MTVISEGQYRVREIINKHLPLYEKCQNRDEQKKSIFEVARDENVDGLLWLICYCLSIVMSGFQSLFGTGKTGCRLSTPVNAKIIYP